MNSVPSSAVHYGHNKEERGIREKKVILAQHFLVSVGNGWTSRSVCTPHGIYLCNFRAMRAHHFYQFLKGDSKEVKT